MIRKILILIFVSVLLAGCITGQPSEKGTLLLTTSPAGAEIYLDNEYSGSTPGTISAIEPGNHTLEFRSKGYKNWKSIITVPSGTSNYFASLTPQPGTVQEPGILPTEQAAVPASVSVRVSRDQMIIGDSNIFSGVASGTDTVTLTLYGPGYYENGIILDKVKPDAVDAWTYTWNPGTKIQAGTYTIIASDAAKTVSERVSFTAIGNGLVSISSSNYAVTNGGTIILSGRCTTGASTVRVVLFGPSKFAGGVDLGTFPVTADQTWSFRYTTDITMPTGVYTVYVNDIPQTATGSTQLTIGFAS